MEMLIHMEWPSVYKIINVCLTQGAARNPNAADQQQKLKQAAEDLRSATNAAASDALKKKLVKRLEVILMSNVSILNLTE